MANPNMSGGDRVCAIYAKKLIGLGHQVNVVAPKKKNLSFKQQIKRVLKGEKWLSRTRQGQNHFTYLGVDIVYADKYFPLMNSSVPDADVVIATWWETVEWVQAFSNKKGKKVYFIQHHETHIGQPIERVKNTYRLPFYKITIAKWLVSLMEIEYGANAPYLVPNSVDHDLFYANLREKQKVPTIGFLFSETLFKGVDVALKVIGNLKSKIPNLRVVAFGSKSPVNIQLPEYVELSINPAQEDIRLIYQQCDLWLCCSVIEGFGLTILEAMACRTPSVSTKCGGAEDIVEDGVNGYLCDVDDVRGLTEASFELLNFTEEEWLGFSGKANLFAKSYSWDTAAKLFESSLQNILDDNDVLLVE